MPPELLPRSLFAWPFASFRYESVLRSLADLRLRASRAIGSTEVVSQLCHLVEFLEPALTRVSFVRADINQQGGES